MTQATNLIQKYDPNAVFSFTVGSVDVSPYLLYKQDASNLLVLAGATETVPLFVPMSSEAAGKPVSAALVGAGTFILTASGSITAGANVTSAASGKVAAATAGQPIIGKAYHAASNGELVAIITDTPGAVASNTLAGTHGQTMTINVAEEEITLSTGGGTTDSTANLLPANSLILQVAARVTTTITTATDWKLGDASTADRFTDANSTLIAGTTDFGVNHWNQAKAAGYTPYQAAAAKLRITTTGTPGAGKIRVTVWSIAFVAPTS